MRDNACAICGEKGKLAVDHDHATGKFRGFICTPCNLGLGHFKDDPRKLFQAMQYVRQHGKSKRHL